MRFRPPSWLIHLFFTCLLIVLVMVVGPQLSYKGYTFLQPLWIQMLVCGFLLLVWGLCHLRIKTSTSTHKGPAATAEEALAAEQASEQTAAVPLLAWKQQFPESQSLPIVLQLSNAAEDNWYFLPELGTPLATKTSNIANHSLTWQLYQDIIIIRCDKNAPLSYWSQLLRTLTPYRHRLTGLIYTLTSEEFIAAKRLNPSALRQQLFELKRRLKRSLPVYIVLLHLEELVGFNHFFAALDDKQQGSSFALTPDAWNLEAWKLKLDDQLQHVIAELKQYRMLALRSQRSVVGQLALYSFPNHFAQLAQQLQHWVNALLLKWPDYYAIKGLFFTAYHADSTKANYFATGLWPLLLNKTNNRLITSFSQRNRQRWMRLTAVGAFSLLILVSGIGLYSYQQQQQWLSSVKQNLQQDNRIDFRRLMNWQKELTQQNFWLPGSLTIKPSLIPVLERLQGRVLAAQLNPGLQAWFHNNLPQQSGIELYRNLRAYLQLGELAQRNFQQLEDWIYSHQASLNTTQGLANQLPELLAYIQRQQVLPLDPSLIRMARAKLQQLTVPELAYLILQEQAVRSANYYQPLTPDQGVILQQVFDMTEYDLRLPTLFTKTWLLTTFPSASQSAIADSKQADWVIGTPFLATWQQDKHALSQAVLALYLKDYVTTWQQHLYHLHIVAIKNLNQAAQIFTLLGQPNSPFDVLLNTLRQNTVFTPPTQMTQVASLNQQLQKMKPGGFNFELAHNYFAGTFGPLTNFALTNNNQPAAGYAAVKTNMQQLGQQLTQLANQPANSLAVLQFVIAHFNGTANDPLQKLQQQLPLVPQPLQNWLQQTLDQVWGLLLMQAQQQLNTLWQQQVMTFYQSALRGRYPLQPNSQTSIAMEDFNRFFSPTGVLAQFSQQYLTPFIDKTSSNTWQWRQLYGRSLGLSDQLLQELQQAQLFQQAFFPDTSGQAKVTFELLPQDLSANVAQVQLKMGEQTLVYGHGPQRAVTFSWPGQNNAIALNWVNLQNQTFRNELQDSWGLFRLLQNASITQQKEGIAIVFRQGPFYANFVLKPSSGFNPFQLPSFAFDLMSQLN